mgnify:CR=1 FL=1
MPITFPITLPTSPTSRSISIRKRSAVAVAASPFTFQAQSYVWSGQIWFADINLPAMTRAQAEPWIAKLAALNGREGSFLLGDTANKTARGVATGTPLVKGAGQTGQDLITDGWTISTTGILKAGDWIQLGSGSTARLYKVLADANSNGSGEATLSLWPNLRSSPADNAAITVSSPMGRFMLTDDLDYSINELKKYGLSFQAVEDLRP